MAHNSYGEGGLKNDMGGRERGASRNLQYSYLVPVIQGIQLSHMLMKRTEETRTR